MNKLSQRLRFLSKIANIFAVVIPIMNLYSNPELDKLLSGTIMDFPISGCMLLATFTSILFNIFFFRCAGAILYALAHLIENKEEPK